MKFILSKKHPILLCLFIISIIFSTLYGCNTNSFNDEIRKALSSKIILDFSYMEYAPTGNTVAFGNRDINIIVYIDKKECTPCSLGQMYLWEEFLNNLNKYRNQISLTFIFNPSENIKKETWMRIPINLKKKCSMYIDSKEFFPKANPQISQNILLHVCLVNKDGKILLVGNPIKNKQIKKLYIKKINEFLQKPYN